MGAPAAGFSGPVSPRLLPLGSLPWGTPLPSPAKALSGWPQVLSDPLLAGAGGCGTVTYITVLGTTRLLPPPCVQATTGGNQLGSGGGWQESPGTQGLSKLGPVAGLEGDGRPGVCQCPCRGERGSHQGLGRTEPKTVPGSRNELHPGSHPSSSSLGPGPSGVPPGLGCSQDKVSM